MTARYSIHGERLSGVAFTAKCEECGMSLISAAEFHPREACGIYKLTHDSNKVWEGISPLYAEWQAARP